MALNYSTGAKTQLTDVAKLPISGTFPAITFTGRPGASMKVDVATAAQVVTDGNATGVPEGVGDPATLCAFDPPAAPQGLLEAAR